jgi:hypothetical protein
VENQALILSVGIGTAVALSYPVLPRYSRVLARGARRYREPRGGEVILGTQVVCWHFVLFDCYRQQVSRSVQVRRQDSGIAYESGRCIFA